MPYFFVRIYIMFCFVFWSCFMAQTDSGNVNKKISYNGPKNTCMDVHLLGSVRLCISYKKSVCIERT